MFQTIYSKTNWLQKTTVYQTNEQSTKYSNLNVEVLLGKLLGNTKYNLIKLVLAVFASAYLYKISVKLY